MQKKVDDFYICRHAVLSMASLLNKSRFKKECSQESVKIFIKIIKIQAILWIRNSICLNFFENMK